MELNEKVAYIKGLMDGLELDLTTKEGKVLAAVVEAMEAMAKKVSSMDEEVGDLYDEVDAISEDLSNVEEYLWDDEEDDDGEEEAEEYEDGLYEITCPACGEVVCVDEEMLTDENLACPNCGTKFEVDFGEDADASDDEEPDKQ